MFHGPLIIVYGTQKPERSLILKRAAEKIGDFTVTPEIPIGNKVGRFMIKADTEVSEAELLSHNFFLFGNREENRITAALTAKWGEGFPVRLVGDDLRVGNREFKKSMLGLTYPNPWAPQYLAGIMTLPFSKEAVDQWVKYANIPLRNSPVNSSAIDCYILPDVIVMESPTEVSTKSWSFDQEWKELIPIN
ncbi:MAG TPA: hypothetical protein VHY08_04165 [Bacillota bacterium]|nr:hypothetical protein [Bacillota bacterium]